MARKRLKLYSLSDKLSSATAVLISFCTFSILFVLLKFSSYGFDFSDESFYLVWISNPFNYSGSVTQFGFIYHPLYLLCGGNIAALRQFNILITFGLGWSLTYFLLDSIEQKLKKHFFFLLAISASIGSSTLLLFDTWLTTPSYNSLALQGLLVTSIGLIVSNKNTACKRMFPSLLIGIGGWLTFMAKPSSALALVMFVFVFLLVTRKISLRLVSVALFSSVVLLLISALVIDGSLMRFFERYKAGLNYAKILGGGHTIANAIRFDDFQLPVRTIYSLLGVFAASTTAIWAIKKHKIKAPFVAFLIWIACFAFTSFFAAGLIVGLPTFGQFHQLLIFGIFYASFFANLSFHGFKKLSMIEANHWYLVILFLIMPYVYAFGTNGNYWQVGGSAAFFWLLSGIIALSPILKKLESCFPLVPIAASNHIIVCFLLNSGLEEPYRQPQPLRTNDVRLNLDPMNSVLWISAGFARYISTARQAAEDAKFKNGTPVIDLTGQSHGLLFALGAKNIGQPWSLGGYPGSYEFLKAGLKASKCEDVATAWLLYEDNGPRSISPEVLQNFGLKFPSDYRLAAEWKTAEGAGGYSIPRIQMFFRPVGSITTHCN